MFRRSRQNRSDPLKPVIGSRRIWTAIGGAALPIAVLVCVGACERRAPLSGTARSPVLATINGKELTKREFDLFLPEDYQNVLTADEKREYLDRWITTQLLYEEALKWGIKASPDIDARLEQYKKDLVADQLVQKVIEERAVVTDKEVRDYYEAQKLQYEKEYRVSHILVNTPEEADTVRTLLKSRSFEDVAKEYSVDRHSNAGGDLGYLSRGNMIPEFEGIVFKMGVGEVSDVIETEFGYHIIKVTDIRDSQAPLEYADIAPEIADILTLQKRQAVYDSLVTALRRRADIEYTDEAVGFTSTSEPGTTARKP